MEHEPANHRFVDENLYRFHFWDKILVHCPKCGGRAEVTRNLETRFLKFDCFNCHHTKRGSEVVFENKIWTDCDSCGNPIRVLVKTREKVKKLNVRCELCGQVRQFQPTHSEVNVVFKDLGNATDPYFELPLWLQGEVKSNVFWAYNYEHLAYMKKYIEAKIRERHPVHMTLLAKLPNFIKYAKNREDLLRLIERLETKTVSLK